MAETYSVVMSIKVIKDSSQEAMVDEENFFNGQNFARMANLADEYYELVSKLQKIK